MRMNWPTAALDEHARAQLESLRRRNEELERRERERESAAFVATVGGTGLAPAVRELAAALDANLGEADRAQYRELLGKPAIGGFPNVGCVVPLVSLGMTSAFSDCTSGLTSERSPPSGRNCWRPAWRSPRSACRSLRGVAPSKGADS